MKRHEAWRAHYRARRYMEHLTDDELQQRAKDVFLNMLVITQEAKIGLPPISPESTCWMEVWTHVLEEFVVRFGPYPAGFGTGFMKTVAIPVPSNPLAERAAAAVSARAAPQGAYLVKYGKLKHLKPAYELGRLRIAPASAYSDPSLNPAIRDEELEVEIQPPPSEIRLTVIDPKSGKSKGSISPLGNKIKKVSRTNYYVSCFSSLFTPRLFLDFDDADACLLITRPREFIEAVFAEFERKLPAFTGLDKPVRYIDPLNTSLRDLDVFFCKHFRYAYQKEFRIVWLPKKLCSDLDPVFLELGKLSDYAELISLAGT
jgi:hypothetical protein